ncbi:MAG TPA: glycosyltransferase family 4 protein [Gaiellaceae bacterium]|nr:glycosyltransferase family 4 protein [Gaiellaceae bacterium]
MTRRLVFVTQRIDPDDPNLGATVALVRALASRLDEVVVLALDGKPGALPGNARLRSFGGGSRAGRGARFAAALARELSPRPLAVLAHMSPIYAVLAAPLARPLGVPVLLWFTHWRRSRLLQLAERLSSAVLSVDSSSFPLPSTKLRAIGHGIDTAEFACVDRSERTGPLRVLALGRTSPAKGLPVVVEGVRLARERGADLELELRGPSITAEERAHRLELGTVAEPLPRERIPELLAGADVLVNNMRAGALDKVVFEACAACLPVLASNPGFAGLLDEELRFDRDHPAELADRLVALAARDAEERAELGRRLRARVEAAHSTDTWAAGVLAAAGR